VFIINLPRGGFDPTETTIPWLFLTKIGAQVLFATPDGNPATADQRMITKGLGLLSPFLMTSRKVLALYDQMITTPQFRNPIAYQDIEPRKIVGLHIPGGHGEEIKSMLESEILQQKISECFLLDKVVSAICTGVLTVARSKDPQTQKSVIYYRRTTAVTRWMELSGWYLTRRWYGNYYRVYPETAQDEIESLLQNKNQFQSGGLRTFPAQYTQYAPALQFIVRDGNYLSGRWPGDCYRFALELVQMIQKKQRETL